MSQSQQHIFVLMMFYTSVLLSCVSHSDDTEEHKLEMRGRENKTVSLQNVEAFESSDGERDVRWESLWWIFNTERLSRVNPTFCSACRDDEFRADESADSVSGEETSKGRRLGCFWSTCGDDKTSTKALRPRWGQWPIVTPNTTNRQSRKMLIFYFILYS